MGYRTTGTISNSFATGDVNGNDTFGGAMGYNLVLLGSTSGVYWFDHTGDDATNCYDGGDSGCVKVSAPDDVSYFYDVTDLPISSWTFPTDWNSFCTTVGYPTLAWQSIDISDC